MILNVSLVTLVQSPSLWLTLILVLPFVSLTGDIGVVPSPLSYW